MKTKVQYIATVYEDSWISVVHNDKVNNFLDTLSNCTVISIDDSISSRNNYPIIITRITYKYE